MAANETPDIKARFENALFSFVEKIKNDPNILSVVVWGSFSNDTVWEKSDIDISVLVREIKLATTGFCVEEDGIILNVSIQTEFDFKRAAERSLGGGGMFSIYSKARVAFCRDESFKQYIEDFQQMGADDMALSFFQCASYLIGDMEKIEKWLTVKKDPLYAQLWTLKAAELYANMRLILDKKPPSREAILKVMEYAPQDIKHLYEKPMSGFLTADEVWDALRFYKKFLSDNLELLKRPVIEYMSDGNVRTVTNLVKHFRMDSHGIYHIFDFLEEAGIIARVTETVKITPKSRKSVEEVAFIYLGEDA